MDTTLIVYSIGYTNYYGFNAVIGNTYIPSGLFIIASYKPQIMHINFGFTSANIFAIFDHFVVQFLTVLLCNF